MKYAIISDIHGNAPAFKMVLEDAKKQGVSDYIIAGDYCLSGPYPDECISLLRQLNSSHIIRGNEEQYLENLKGIDQKYWTDGQMQISYWCYRNIKSENMEYMLNLPKSIDLNCNGIGIHIAHSMNAFLSVSRLEEKIQPSVLALEFRDKPVNREILSEYISNSIKNCSDFGSVPERLTEGVYIFGHTHIQWTYENKDKKIFLINPGSCGLPLDGIPDSVPYAILDISEDGNVSIEQRRLNFDTKEYIKALKKTSQYIEANVWSKVICRELKSAKEHLTFFLQFVEKYAHEINDDRRPFSIDTWEKAYELWESGI